jgi:VCBS repeat-containing protein
VTLNTDGSFTYTPTANYNGPDTLTYKANDGSLDSAAIAVSITVTAVNDAPVAAADSFITNEDTALTVALANGVLVNDTDADGTSVALTAIAVTQPAHGTLTLNANGTLTYTPTANYNGPDSFTYKANDGTADSAVATVNITVTAVNDAPVAVNDNYSVEPGESLTITAPGILSNDTDVENTTLTPTVVTQPLHGTVTVNADGSFTYTPETGSTATTDGFSYTVSDGTATSTVAAVTITIEAAGEGEAADAAMLALLADESDDESISTEDGDWQSAIDEALADLTA